MQKAVADKRRFLAVVWFGSPHSPHRAADEDLRHYPGQSNRHFLGEITGIDRAVGKLRAELDTLKIRDNTIFWYCSDNGALPGVGSTGGHRGHKGSIYEGGLLVPAIIEWPAKIKKPRTTNMRANTSDIYPTLLEIAGVKIDKQPTLDGVSLVGVIDGKTTARAKPMGFWDYPAGGISAHSDRMMREVLAAQKAGNEPADKSKLRLDAGKISKKYTNDDLHGHAAWIDGDWKLHRIAGKGRGRARSRDGYELYNLAKDRKEAFDLIKHEPARAKQMKAALAAWQKSVVASLNGEDY
jgi:arylsulfatase A-like enzyme